MSATLPVPVTALYLAFFAFFYVALTLNVIRNRWKHRVSLGHGSNSELMQCVRVHGNFAEYTPFMAALLLTLELSGRSHATLHTLGAGFAFGRVAHAYGVLNRRGPSAGRAVGMVLTIVTLVAAGVSLIGVFTGQW